MTAPLPAWSDSDGARRASDLFTSTFATEPAGVWASPGRVNLIGEHVDYNGGLCLPMALPHRTFAAARRRDDLVVRLSPPWRRVRSGPGAWPGSPRGWSAPGWPTPAAPRGP